MHASVLCVFTGEKLNGDMNQVERLVDKAASAFVGANIADYGKLDYNRNSLLTASKGILGDEVTAKSLEEHRFAACDSEDFKGLADYPFALYHDGEIHMEGEEDFDAEVWKALREDGLFLSLDIHI